MSIKPKKFMKSIVVLFLPLLFLIVIGDVSITYGMGPDSKVNHSYIATNREADRFKVLSVLKNRVGDRKLTEKAKEKLLTLSTKKTHLIAALSERITNAEETAGSDIAFLLIIALIVLS